MDFASHGATQPVPSGSLVLLLLVELFACSAVKNTAMNWPALGWDLGRDGPSYCLRRYAGFLADRSASASLSSHVPVWLLPRSSPKSGQATSQVHVRLPKVPFRWSQKKSCRSDSSVLLGVRTAAHMWTRCVAPFVFLLALAGG